MSRPITAEVSRSLHAEAVSLGVPLSTKTFSNWGVAGLDERAARRRLHQYHAVFRAAGAEGVPVDVKQVSGLLGETGGDHDAAVQLLLGPIRRVRARATKRCEVTLRSRDNREALAQTARCNCAECLAYAIGERLHPAMRMIIRKHGWMRELPDIEQEGLAVATWVMNHDHGDPYAIVGYFKVAFLSRARRMMREQLAPMRNPAEATLSLDAPIVGGTDNGRFVTFADRIPDRSIDVVTIVCIRERIREAVTAHRDMLAAAA